MASWVTSVDKFHQQRGGKLVFGAIEIAIAVILAIFAVDTGFIWQHLLAIVFFIGGLRNIVNAFHHMPKHAKKAKR